MSAIELARQLARHPRFVVLPGLRFILPVEGLPARVISVDPYLAAHEDDGARITGRHPSEVPDLADAATVGVLFEMLQRVDGASSWSLSNGYGVAIVSRDTGSFVGGSSWNAPTPGEAVARALLAVWGAE